MESEKINELRAYIKEFNLTGELEHKGRNSEYDSIIRKFSWKMYTREEAENVRQEAYEMAKDDEIATFFFKQSFEYFHRKEMLSVCIRKFDIDRAIELVDMMISTQNYPGYSDTNGRGRNNMLTFSSLIRQYDYNNKQKVDDEQYLIFSDEDAVGITDEMRVNVKQLVERIMPCLPQKPRAELGDILHKITPKKSEFDVYIDNLMDDVMLYTTFPKPIGKKGAYEINRLSMKITDSFKHLSEQGRVDVIGLIMQRFAMVKDVLKPVTYNTWMSGMLREVSDSDIHKLYQQYTNIFEALIECDGVRESDIQRVAERLGKCCTRSEYQLFVDKILVEKGYIEGIDNCYMVTSENYPTQVLFDGKTVKIELDYPEINDTRSQTEFDLFDISLHLLTTKKDEKLSSIRVASFKVNGIEMIDEFGYFEFNDAPSVGYAVKENYCKNDLTMYSGPLKKHGVEVVDKIELLLISKDTKKKKLESSNRIVIEYNEQRGEYTVIDE